MELVGLVISHCSNVTQPLAALVSRTWNRALGQYRNLLPRPDPARSYRPLPYEVNMFRYVPQSRRAQDAEYRENLANAKRAVFACRVVKTRCRALIEWVFTEGGFRVIPKTLSKAAATGDLDLLRWLVQRCASTPATIFPILGGAARSGSVITLEWAHATFKIETAVHSCERAMTTAAEHNQQTVIEWLRTHDCPWSEAVTTAAARSGHFDLLVWLHAQGCPMGSTVASESARSGRLDIADWLGTLGHHLDGAAFWEAACGGHVALFDQLCARNIQPHSDAWIPAIEHGNLAMCERLYSIDCPKVDRAFKVAARYRHLEMMLWLRDHGFQSALPNFAEFAFRGDIQALEWLSCHGFDPSGEYLAITAVGEGHADVLEWFCERDEGVKFKSSVLHAAAHGRKWTIVKWLCDRGCSSTSPDICAYAMSSSRLDMVEYLRTHGCPWDERVSYCAAHAGRLDTLQWLRDRGCPWDSQLYIAAARGRHYHIVEWALAHGCPYDASLCATIAALGDLECLKQLRQRGMPWDARTCEEAAVGLHLETLQWAIANGCPHSLSECRSRAVHREKWTVVDWLDSLMHKDSRSDPFQT